MKFFVSSRIILKAQQKSFLIHYVNFGLPRMARINTNKNALLVKIRVISGAN